MPENDTNQPYDVIIIGSGMSGLTIASIYAQCYGKRVLLLERHSKIGGFTHSFKRLGKFEWDVGLHYVGGMQTGSITRAVFDYITAGQLKWNKLPDPYDVFVYPDFRFNAREGEDNLRSDLSGLFPDEARALVKYFKDMKKVIRWYNRFMLSIVLPHWLKIILYLLKIPGRKLALCITGDYLDNHFNNKTLKSLLVSQWGDYGLPPGKSAFVIHSMIVQHYIDGAYYPIGGSKKIAASVIPLIEKNGGAAVTRSAVEKIIIENGRALGVVSMEKKGDQYFQKEYFANTIISAIGSYATFNQLITSKKIQKIRNTLAKLPPGVANVTLFIGLKEDPQKLGWKGENYWIYDSFDHDDIFDSKNELLKGQARAVYVSFPSKKNPEATNHTMELITFVDYEPFKEWTDQPVKNRDQKYLSLKKKISDAMINLVEKYFPGFSDLIDYTELGTPLTTMHYTGHSKGNIYGIPAVPDRYKLEPVNIRSPIKNLYLSGADIAGHGIVGAMMSGLISVAVIQGFPIHFMKIVSRIKKFSKNR